MSFLFLFRCRSAGMLVGCGPGAFLCIYDDAVRCMTGGGEAKPATSAWGWLIVLAFTEAVLGQPFAGRRDGNAFGSPIPKIHLLISCFGPSLISV